MGDADRDEDEDDAVSLVRLAGARPMPSEDRTAEARAYVHAAWRAGIRRRRARTSAWLAAAAVAALALASLARRAAPPQPAATPPHASGESPAVVARLDAAAGLVERETASGWLELEAGARLPPGSRVRTDARGAAFLVEGGRSVRIAAESRLLWDVADRLSLEAGAVYVDSGGGSGPDAPFEVRTPWGAVRETGTQFEVRLEPRGLRLRVREGRVALLGRGPTLDVSRGTELRVDDAGSSRRAIPIHGAEWSWVLATAPAFEMDGRRLHELLAWAAREAGWELRYADAESRRRSEGARLHGSIQGLRPDEAVSAVVPSTGLPHRLREGVLEVGPLEAAAVR
jgi:ferric-dicitrate binding protein FerR (iron transport regulator)